MSQGGPCDKDRACLGHVAPGDFLGYVCRQDYDAILKAAQTADLKS